jgi:hypothetical protein
VRRLASCARGISGASALLHLFAPQAAGGCVCPCGCVKGAGVGHMGGKKAVERVHVPVSIALMPRCAVPSLFLIPSLNRPCDALRRSPSAGRGCGMARLLRQRSAREEAEIGTSAMK